MKLQDLLKKGEIYGYRRSWVGRYHNVSFSGVLKFELKNAGTEDSKADDWFSVKFDVNGKPTLSSMFQFVYGDMNELLPTSGNAISMFFSRKNDPFDAVPFILLNTHGRKCET